MLPKVIQFVNIKAVGLCDGDRSKEIITLGLHHMVSMRKGCPESY